MITQKMINTESKEVGTVELAEDVFGIKPKKHLLKDVVVMQLANRRGGNASTKTRKDVRGGGAKPFRQKGTGNARQGTIRSPLMEGGGIVFGPHPRDYSYKVPKKVRRAALKTAMIMKMSEGKLFVFDKLEFKTPKTKAAKGIFGKLNISNALVVDSDNANLELSVRNLPGYKYIRPEGINVFDIMKHEGLVFTKDSIKRVEEALLR